jgi:hypothetical protein
MENLQADTATTLKSLETFRAFREFYAEHFGNQVLRVQLTFAKKCEKSRKSM